MIPSQVIAKVPSAIRPNLSSIGFGVFLATNAAYILGGAFPFLPLEYQTTINMFFYYLAESLSFGITLIFAALIVYRYPGMAVGFSRIALGAYVIGCACTVAVMYITNLSLPLFIASGLFLGLGSAGFYLAWQQIFSLQDSCTGTHNLILGMFFSGIIYIALYLVPIAVTHLLIPCVLLPTIVLCLALERRAVAEDNPPMLEDAPSQHRKVYKQAMHDYWRSALSIGAIGLASGIIRSVSIANASMGNEVNAAAIGGSFVAATVLLIVLNLKTLRFSIISLFRIAFPFLIAGFLFLPIFGMRFAHMFSTGLYAFYSASIMLMMIQCAQSSRDRGLNPLIVFGGFGGIVYTMHDAGFLSGYAARYLEAGGFEPFWAVSLVAVALLALIVYVGFGGISEAIQPLQQGAEQIEMLEFKTKRGQRKERDLNASRETNEMLQSTRNDAAINSKKRAIDRRDTAESENEADTTFPISKLTENCSALQRENGLTNRETEVMVYLYRGMSMRAIAEELVVSENTIRTHAKHIYSKLSIHKRSELQRLLDQYLSS